MVDPVAKITIQAKNEASDQLRKIEARFRVDAGDVRQGGKVAE